MTVKKNLEGNKHEKIFYTEHKKIGFNIEDIEYNRELLTKVWKEEENLEGTEDEIENMVTEIFWEKLSYQDVYFEPIIFDEEKALLCGLTPFTYKGINLLALSGGGMNLSPRLDAYQFLTHKTIDKNSLFFSDEKYFKYVVGEKIMNKINENFKGK